MYYPAASRGSIFLRCRLPNKQEGAQTVKNRCLCVGGVYHRRYTPTPDTTATNLPVRTFPRDVQRGMMPQDLNQRHTKAVDGHRLAVGGAACRLLVFCAAKRLASQNFCTQLAQLLKMMRSTIQATFGHSVCNEDAHSKPIEALVHNRDILQNVHKCLLLQYEYVIDALLQPKVSLCFDFFTFRYIHIRYKVLVIFVTAER